MKELETKEEHLALMKEYGVDLSNIVNPHRVRFNAGELLVEDGTRAEHLFFLIDGTVRTLIPAEGKSGLVIGRYVNRGIFDDTVLFRKDGRNHIRAVAETTSEVIAIPREINTRTLKEQPAFLQYIAENYAVFIDQTMNSFYFQKYPFEYLLCSYIAVTRTGPEWVEDLETTAKELKSTPRNVERCLSLLVNKGILEQGEKGYFVSDILLFEEYNKGLYRPRKR